MFSKFAGLQAGQPSNSRRFGAGAIVVSGAVVAVLGAGGVATASSSPAAGTTGATTTGTIKACYQTTTSPATIKHIPTSSTCARGNSTLTWNQVGPRGPQGPAGPQGLQGPQGPAGISVGTSGTSGTSVPLNQAQTLKTVLSGSAAPASGTYYVNASVMLVVAQGDTVACILADNGNTVGAFSTVGPVANQTYETLPLSGAISMSAGDTPQVQCSDYTSSNTTSFYDGGITSVLINSPTGGATAHGVNQRPSHQSLPPHL